MKTSEIISDLNSHSGEKSVADRLKGLASHVERLNGLLSDKTNGEGCHTYWVALDDSLKQVYARLHILGIGVAE